MNLPNTTVEFENAGRSEVQRCRREPGHRNISALRSLSEGLPLLRSLRLAAVRSLEQSDVLLSVLSILASLSAKVPGLKNTLARRIVRLRNSLLFYRGAVEEAGGWNAFQREFAVRLPVLCYHHVGQEVPGSWPLLTLSVAVFEQQMSWLVDHGYTGISAAEWLAWLESGKPLPGKPVLITFDDAYSDLAQTAIPILRKYGLKASLFLVSQYVGGDSAWDHSLGYPSQPLMSVEEVLYAAHVGLEIGSHTRTHRDLRKLSKAELRAELELSRDELASLTGAPVRALAYPFGFENNLVRECAAEFYGIAFRTKPGLNLWTSDRHKLCRMFVAPSSVNFACQVKYGLDLQAMLRVFPERLRTAWRLLAARFHKSNHDQSPVPSAPVPRREAWDSMQSATASATHASGSDRTGFSQ